MSIRWTFGVHFQTIEFLVPEEKSSYNSWLGYVAFNLFLTITPSLCNWII